MAQITYSGLSNIRLSAMLMNEVNLLLADPTNLSMYEGIFNAGSVVGMGSDSLSMRFLSAGHNQEFASTGDGVEVTGTDPAESKVDFQVARYALRYDLTSLAQMTGYGRDLDPFSLAQMMVQSAISTMSTVIATQFQSISGNAVGTSGVDLSVDDILDAIFELESDSNDTFSCILHSVQFNDFRQSLRSESNNAFGFNNATYEMMKAKAPGYAGEWGGVQFYKSNKVTETGGNKIGAMLGSNAIGYVLGAPQDTQLSDGRIVPAGTPAIIEFNRNAAYDQTEIVGNMYFGVNIAEQARCCKITSDA